MHQTPSKKKVCFPRFPPVFCCPCDACQRFPRRRGGSSYFILFTKSTAAGEGVSFCCFMRGRVPQYTPRRQGCPRPRQGAGTAWRTVWKNYSVPLLTQDMYAFNAFDVIPAALLQKGAFRGNSPQFSTPQRSFHIGVLRWTHVSHCGKLSYPGTCQDPPGILSGPSTCQPVRLFNFFVTDQQTSRAPASEKLSPDTGSTGDSDNSLANSSDNHPLSRVTGWGAPGILAVSLAAPRQAWRVLSKGMSTPCGFATFWVSSNP